MRVLVVVNDALDVGVRQTTTMLMAEGIRRGHEVAVAGAAELGWSEDDGVVARSRSLGFESPTEAAEVPAALGRARVFPRAVAAGELVLVRTSPGRDTKRAQLHRDVLSLLGVAARRGAVVLNRPGALLGAGGKLLLLDLPESMRPRCVVSSDLGRVRDFVLAQAGDVVLKPLHGTRGIDVMRVSKDHVPEHGTPLEEALERLREAPILAQEYLPEAVRGDTRVVVAGGEVVRVDGHPAAVRRIPADNDWRSNMHTGAAASPPEWTDSLERLCSSVARRLYALGIWSAGLDVIGDRIIEINVFSPGGLGSAGTFAGVDFVPALFASAEREVARN